MPEDYTFEAFAQHGFYEVVNRHLVDITLRLRELSQAPIKRVLDLACGTGAVTKLLIEGLERNGDRAEVIAVDPSESALEKARRLIGTGARFVRGTAGSFAARVPKADVIVFCNAIHLLPEPEKDSVVRQAHDVLNQDGVLAFNTSFYEGAYPPGTERFYKLWMLRSLQELKREHPGLKLDRGRPEAMKWLTPEEYRELLERHGFVVEHMNAEEALMTCESWQDISHYAEFVKGALPGIPVEIGAPILKRTVAQAFEELHMERLPRNWLQVVARAA
ncbi:MAG TPA: class I SAM-dependent methyltransferase [Chloroflexota bacterium]|jgi:SAM-dependent methyltransferase|nr:class I SAM-dependent methyltransferase [Chloroflexota bacterium]